MITIRAAQLIYSRVEIDYSPQRRSGYQTAYRSPSLTAEEVSFVERRVQCFQPPRSTDDRLQYFSLPSGKAVVARTVPIVSDPDITDKTRRSGAFLAHCLILNSAEFASIGNNAFALFEAFGFLEDPRDMVDEYLRAPSVEEPARIEVRTELSFDTGWPEEEAFNLLTLALQADELVKTRRGLLFTGSAADIQEAIRTAVVRLEPSRRVACSFDTCVDRCLTTSGTYWAVGMAQRQTTSGLILVDAGMRRVQASTTVVTGSDLYLSWLRHVSARSDMTDQVRTYGPTIQRLATAFTQRHRPRVEELDPAACAAFLSFHGKRVWADVETALAVNLGRGLATALTQYLRAQGDQIDPAEIVAGAAAQQYPPAHLSDVVLEWITLTGPNLKDSDWKTIADFGAISQKTALRFLAIVSQKKIDHVARVSLLESIPPHVFRHMLDQLGSVVEPALFVCSAHIAEVINNLPETLTDERFVDVIGATLEAGDLTLLNQLTPRIHTLESEAFSALLKLVRKREDIPLSFRSALKDRRDQLPRRIWPF